MTDAVSLMSALQNPVFYFLLLDRQYKISHYPVDPLLA
jgi:hypothetical protein